MKRLLHPLIACALVTIVPFLLTFEKGQDIVRGLFDYEIFGLLLFIVFVKEKLLDSFQAKSSNEKESSKKKRCPIMSGMTAFCNLFNIRSYRFLAYAALLVILVIALIAVAWVDLQNLLAIKGWNTSWYGILPFITCGLAIVMIWQIKPFKFNNICFILFVALILHLEAYNQYPAQPLAQLPTFDYLERTAPKQPQRDSIPKELSKKFIVTDSASITKKHIDTTRTNVIILVESWGVPLDTSRFSHDLKTFKSIPKKIGIHHRMYSRTRTAEREDLIYKIQRDSPRLRDTTFLPKVFSDAGFKTTFLFGGDSLEHSQFKYIKNIGFSEAFYGKNLNNKAIAHKIDSILTDTTQKRFIAWTTRDTKFPLPECPDIYNSNPDAIDSAYSERLIQTLETIASLAHKHPETRFIVQGDHNPILSPIKFQERFYKRWVPFVILN